MPAYRVRVIAVGREERRLTGIAASSAQEACDAAGMALEASARPASYTAELDQ
jgi:hypothetical protein